MMRYNIIIMALKICSFSSGSSGNCVFVSSEKTKILVDMGIPFARLQKSMQVLGESMKDISVLITHTHSDHIGHVGAMQRVEGAKVYAHYLSGSVKNKGKFTFCEFDSEAFSIGDILVKPFSVPHDVPCVGYQLECGGKSVSVVTDFGEASEKCVLQISESDIVMIEANHDEGLLTGGTYPWHLKRRVLSKEGHLSNSACAEVCVKLAEGRTKQIILGHLSRENNYPELAFKTVADRLRLSGCKEGQDIRVEVAPSHCMSGLYQVC